VILPLINFNFGREKSSKNNDASNSNFRWQKYNCRWNERSFLSGNEFFSLFISYLFIARSLV